MRATGYAEVTVALAFVKEDGSVIHDNIGEATLSFAIRMPPPPREFTAEETQQIIANNLGPVLAVVETALRMNGLEPLGAVDEPMTNKSTQVGVGRTGPLRVTVIEKEPELSQ